VRSRIHHRDAGYAEFRYFLIKNPTRRTQRLRGEPSEFVMGVPATFAHGASKLKIALYHNKDFWAGIMLIATGALSIFIARDYPFGSTIRMGPGYFPSVLGGILVLFGLYVMIMGLRSGEKITVQCSLRALIVLSLSLVAFGFLMTHAGFIPALAVLIFGSASAGREFRFVEVLLLTVILTALSVTLFIWGLGLPYPLIKGF
jgi:Tripartite tricarboxylate transporter TctB family